MVVNFGRSTFSPGNAMKVASLRLVFRLLRAQKFGRTSKSVLVGMWKLVDLPRITRKKNVGILKKKV